MLAGQLQNPSYDVVVVGSGAGGMVAALRAHELGLRPIILEKSDRYGGTSAVSGSGLWIPNNPYIRDRDSDEAGFEYLQKTTEGKVSERMLWRYIRTGPKLLEFLKQVGVEYYVNKSLKYPDYHPDVPGALPQGRAMFVKPFDGGQLGREFFNLRESYPEFKLFERITMDLDEGADMIRKESGWQLVLLRQLLRYAFDLRWRFRTHRDRRLAHGNALIGRLRYALMQRDIPVVLKTRMLRLNRDHERITGVTADCDGREISIEAKRGVVLATGGYEQSQELRSKYLPRKSQSTWSITPRGNNTGDGLLAALDVGADVAMLGECWWAPSVALPTLRSPNVTRNQGVFFERGLPHSVCVNRLGERFVDEATSYHRFGQAMIADDARTGANMPCWIVFDSRFRSKYPLAGLLPGSVKPDSMLPSNWLDTVLHRAESIEALAASVALPPAALRKTIDRFNTLAEKGVDEDFGRGGNFYDQYQGDPKHKPNPCLGPVSKPPFYAVRIDLGDLGSKGGPVTDEHARVLTKAGTPIEGLYAIGNCAATIMGSAYPGAGVTLGTTMMFGMLASQHIAGAHDAAAEPVAAPAPKVMKIG